jgi:multiple sugar transport system permease protein
VSLRSAPAAPDDRVDHRRGSRAEGKARKSAVRSRKSGYAFVAGYFVLLILFGVVPTVYALILAITSSSGHFVGLSNFITAYHDYRFVPAFEHIAEYMVIWLSALVIFVVILALLLHSLSRKVSSVFRFLFYLPGALAGAASVLVWLFMLEPGLSPWNFILKGFGFSSLDQVLLPGHLPVIFVLIAFWTGAGGWIVVMYGALNTIPDELMEAAQLDGASAWQTAFKVKLPLIKRWIVYMVILAFATGSQIFVEPQLVGQASLGLVSPFWSPNQLAYVMAFQNNNFNEASAVSVDLLILGLMCAVVLVFRTKLFEVD